jgi:hypothetical protein
MGGSDAILVIDDMALPKNVSGRQLLRRLDPFRVRPGSTRMVCMPCLVPATIKLKRRRIQNA